METRGASGHWVSLDERAWHIETVWQAAEGLPVEEVPIADIPELDEDCWFNGAGVAVRAVVDHARRINEADLGVPVILASDGQVLDGMHRIAKAALHGHATVLAQRLRTDPDPDWLLPKGSSV
ncbi:MAG: hypothetical protein ACXVW6_05015 [Nocardioidaceae bacterium]